MHTRGNPPAFSQGLHTASKRDSVGICFVGKRRFGTFLQEYLPQAPGPFVCIETGEVVGEHRGYALYTAGQRARLAGQRSRWYVVDKDRARNVVRVCEGREHPALFTHSFVAEAPAWISGEPPRTLASGRPLHCHARIRYPGDLHACTVEVCLLYTSPSPRDS